MDSRTEIKIPPIEILDVFILNRIELNISMCNIDWVAHI